MEGEITEETFDREFRRSKKVRVKKERQDSILTMRINETLLRSLSKYAYEKDMSMSAAARHLLYEGLRLHEDEGKALADLLVNAANRLRDQNHSPTGGPAP